MGMNQLERTCFDFFGPYRLLRTIKNQKTCLKLRLQLFSSLFAH